ncbi:MAG TPA: FHA domain-containing protein [Pseudonocardiaceae bacterium]|nr:FHA domain-containing protein [Pseudonocardiaceae bacterium]
MSQPAGEPLEQPSERGGVSTVPSFEALQAAVRAGDGIVARFPGLVLAAAADKACIERLLEICRGVSAASSRAPGRSVARRLAGWLAGVDEPVDFGVVAATDDALAVFLCGRAALLIPGEPTLSGTQAAAWVDRQIPWPPASFVLTLGGSESAKPVPLRDLSTVLDLRGGVVPGEGLLLAPFDARPVPSASAASSAAVSSAANPAPEETPPPVPLIVVAEEQPRPALEPPARAEAISGVPPGGTPRLPLPEVTTARQLATSSQLEPEGVRVDGFLCAREHLNDPRALFCANCGIRMAHRTCVLVPGIRPPLGLLVFDDGASFTLDDDYLLGRDPEVDKRVQEGALRPLMIDDSKRLVGRAHLEITLQGWDVYITDKGSANGTLVATPEAQSYSALVPGQPLRLRPGARVSIGNRSFVFESNLTR